MIQNGAFRRVFGRFGLFVGFFFRGVGLHHFAQEFELGRIKNRADDRICDVLLILIERLWLLVIVIVFVHSVLFLFALWFGRVLNDDWLRQSRPVGAGSLRRNRVIYFF